MDTAGTLHDPGTGLPTPALFMDRLEQALARARRHGFQVALLSADVGEDVELALMRECDSVTRMGRRLLIVCGELRGADAAAAVAARTAAGLGEDAQIGMAVSTDGCDPPGRLLEAADAAMRRSAGAVEAADELTHRRMLRRQV